MPSLVRIGFIGVGGIARHHIQQLEAIAEAKITALCDVERVRAEAAAEPLGARVYADSAELIEQAEIDALYICLPPCAHGDLEVRAAEKRLHLFVEKPVSLYREEALRAQ